LDFCKWVPSRELLDALLCMLVDGTFDINEKTTIKVSSFMILAVTTPLGVYLIIVPLFLFHSVI